MKPLDPRLLRHARAARRHLAATVAVGTATGVLVLLQAQLLARGIARVVTEGVGAAAIAPVLVGLAAVLAGRAALAWLTEVVSHRSTAAVKSELRRALVRRAAALGPAARPADRAELATLAVDGLDGLDGYFSRYLPQLGLAVTVPLLVVARLVRADLTTAVIVVLTVPLIPVFMVLIGKATQAATARRWRALARLSHHFLDVVSGMPTLKAFGRGTAQPDAVRTVTGEYRRATMATLRVAFLSSLALELLATLSVAIVAVSVGLRLVGGDLDLETGLLAIILAPEAYLPIREVGVRFHAAADGLAAAERAFAVIDAPVPTGGDETDVPDVRAGGRIEVRGARITHPGREGAAPDGVDLVARPGEVVALAGPSGAGKTSLLAAVLGTMPLAGGSIVVRGGGRGVDLADVDLAAWRRNLAWVDQAPYLFAGTVADNVRLADPAAPDAAVRRSLDAVGLAEMALDRPVREGGTGLSSGERRRVALARAVLRDAPVVLLDEPTAGLDEATEAVVLEAIRRVADRAVVLMAAHRPAALAAADQVVPVAASGASAADGPEAAAAAAMAGALA